MDEYRICRADPSDAEEFLKLQFLAFQSEALVWDGDYRIQPLVQPLKEVYAELEFGYALKAVREDGHIVGCVRGIPHGDTLEIIKLVVHPHFRCRGIAGALLREIEVQFPAFHYKLYTSCRSKNNIRLYERAGYHFSFEEKISDIFSFIHMEK